MPRSTKFDFSGVDWSLTNVQIANQLGCTEANVCRKRQQLGIPTYAAQRWDGIDWTLSDREIAEQIGSHPVYVWEKRKKLGKLPRASWVIYQDQLVVKRPGVIALREIEALRRGAEAQRGRSEVCNPAVKTNAQAERSHGQ